MKIAYFDCFSGISGDMAVGALLDAGVPFGVLEEGISRLGLPEHEVRLGIRTIQRSQIYATKFDVVLPNESSHSHEHHEHHEHAHEHHGHEHHDHGHEHHDHGHHTHEHHSHEHHTHEHTHDHHHGHRSYADIVAMIEASSLSNGVKRIANNIFRVIGIAEARIHNMDPDLVQFHEVGATDSIVDIVGVAICLEHLGISEVYSSVIPLGSGGMIKTQHGIVPLPAPASLEIMKGYPTALTDVPFELTTPTGAGIIKALSKGTLGMEALRVERIGFGAGTRELKDRPNLLRVIIGERVADEEHDTVVKIEANIDDMNPQLYPYVIEQLLSNGAIEAFISPVVMKKGRPGMILTALAPAGAVDGLTQVIYRETTTIGVRYCEMTRRKLPREEVLVNTAFGIVKMKKIESAEGIRIVPEYNEALRIARERSMPLREVLSILQDAAKGAV